MNFDEDTIIATGYVCLSDAAIGAILSEKVFLEI